MKTKQKTVKYGTSHIAAAMRVKYPSNAYAVLFEVANATGLGCNRHADAIVMSLWPSRGLHVTGFEFKASRPDWVKELKDPSKAEAVAQYCDYWTLAVADESIVHAGELPAGWGLMAVHGKTLKTITEPVRLEPKPWPREFLAAVMRSVSEPVAAVDQSSIRMAELRGKQEAEKALNDRYEQLNRRYLDFRREVDEFTAATGIRINPSRWGDLDRTHIMAAMQALSDGSHVKILSELRELTGLAERLAGSVKGKAEAVASFVAESRKNA